MEVRGSCRSELSTKMMRWRPSSGGVHRYRIAHGAIDRIGPAGGVRRPKFPGERSASPTAGIGEETRDRDDGESPAGGGIGDAAAKGGCITNPAERLQTESPDSSEVRTRQAEEVRVSGEDERQASSNLRRGARQGLQGTTSRRPVRRDRSRSSSTYTWPRAMNRASLAYAPDLRSPRSILRAVRSDSRHRFRISVNSRPARRT